MTGSDSQHGARAMHGWGVRSDAATEQESQAMRSMLIGRFGDAVWADPPPLPDPDVTAARLTVPAALVDLVSVDPADRAAHATGRSFMDLVRLREGPFPAAPDAVARPADATDVPRILEWCADVGAACIPFGGGTSVVGGVSAEAAGRERPVVTMQMRRMDRVVEIERSSRSALIQAGATGPVLEGQLRPHGVTMRFFPQSFEMATLGGWIATRAGGHYATRLTHIDDLVQQIEAVTPAGVWASRRLPASGAGPSPDRVMLGSEGILGVITQAWVRLQDLPTHKATRVVAFADLTAALLALGPLVQSGLDPSNCRVLDPLEALINGAGDGSHAVMLVGFESPVIDVTADMQASLRLLADHGGRALEPPSAPGGEGDSAADAWKQSFLRAPYTRDVMVDAGMVVETFETAVATDGLIDLVEQVMAATARAVTEICGEGMVTCRVTHAYPDGAAPYFTVIAPGRRGARVRQWQEIKAAASEVIMAAGGTITHHHAVGRDHRPWYDQQRPDLFAHSLDAVKRRLDPSGILNPGVLIR